MNSEYQRNTRNITPHPNQRQYTAQGYPQLSNAELMNQLYGNSQPKILQPPVANKSNGHILFINK